MRYPSEPHVAIGGVLIHAGAISTLNYLYSTGHTVTLDADGGLQIAPCDDLHPDTAYVVEAFCEDIIALLLMGNGTVH